MAIHPRVSALFEAELSGMLNGRKSLRRQHRRSVIPVVAQRSLATTRSVTLRDRSDLGPGCMADYVNQTEPTDRGATAPDAEWPLDPG